MIRPLFALSILVLSTGCTIKSRTETPTTAYDYSGYDVYDRPADAYRQPVGDQRAGGSPPPVTSHAFATASQAEPPAFE